MYKKARSCGRERLIKVFQRNFSSSVYGFNFENKIDIERYLQITVYKYKRISNLYLILKV